MAKKRIYTKLFDGYSNERSQGGYRGYKGIDNQINDFQESNPHIEIVDIKLAVQPDGDLQNLVALVIYTHG